MRFLISLRLTVFLIVISAHQLCRAEFPAIEGRCSEVAEELSAKIVGKRTLVCVRAAAGFEWPVHEAVCLELTSSLRERQVDAVRSARVAVLSELSDSREPFTPRDSAQIRQAGFQTVVTGYLRQGPRSTVTLDLKAQHVSSRRPVFARRITLRRDDVSLSKNVPRLNAQVLRYCTQNFGVQVGDGICASLAGFALKDVGADRPGVYTWGREMDDREPLMPGDVLQMELLKMEGPGFSRSFAHHTAVVESVTPRSITVLHQNVGGTKIVMRDTWPVTAKRQGLLQAYRPWNGDSVLQSVSPRRQSEPQIVTDGLTVDLLATLDPRLDAVKGLWFRDGGLKSNRDTPGKTQIPVSPPGSYRLEMTVRRLFGSDNLGIGLVVGGKQVLLVLDAYRGTVTGLHFLDQKKANSNLSTKKISVLPVNEWVRLAVDVSPGEIILSKGESELLRWQGSPAQLSMDPNYAMPRSDWLFLAVWNTQFEIRKYRMHPK